MVFVIHWHESAMDLHVFTIPIPPPTSLSTREQHRNMYIIKGETDHQPRLDAWDKCSGLVHWDIIINIFLYKGSTVVYYVGVLNILKYMCACSIAKSCSALCYPMDCSPPGFSVHGIPQARILEWVVISSSRGFSLPRNQTQTWVSFTVGDSLL